MTKIIKFPKNNVEEELEDIDFDDLKEYQYESEEDLDLEYEAIVKEYEDLSEEEKQLNMNDVINSILDFTIKNKYNFSDVFFVATTKDGKTFEKFGGHPDDILKGF